VCGFRVTSLDIADRAPPVAHRRRLHRGFRENGAYTLYTIYASSEAGSIGSGVTSGCVGLLSQDMIDLYSQTPVKTKVVVLPA
jgi:lipoprotein-anchoring transpeptidase ErfK/SrfK